MLPLSGAEAGEHRTRNAARRLACARGWPSGSSRAPAPMHCRASRAAIPSRSRRAGARRSSPAAASRGVEVAHLSRHGAGHVRLSNHVTHRANIAALAELGVEGVLAVTVCGAVDPGVPLGSLICFDDLHFTANRLPDGALCTFFAEAGEPQRGHWIYEDPFSPELRAALLGRRGGGRAARPRRRLLRPRRRAALQHPRGDPRARARGRDRRVPDRRPGDRARRGGRAALRAASATPRTMPTACRPSRRPWRACWS